MRRIAPANVPVRIAIAFAIVLSASPALALTDADQDWFGPQQGDIELGGSLSFATLFNSKVTGIDSQIIFGYFFTDWLEGGLGVQLGWFSGNGKSTVNGNNSSPLVVPAGYGARELTLTTGHALTQLGPEFYGGFEGWLRFFPFTAIWDELLPKVIAPFVNVEFGPLFASDYSPFLSFSASLGMNVYLTEQVALTMEVGYGFVLHTGSEKPFFDRSKAGTGVTDQGKMENLLGFNIGLSFFFTA